MSGFDEREKAFETKFKMDQDLQFKVNNRRNKLLGMWAAGELGRAGEAADAYAKEVVMSDFEKAGDDDVAAKVAADLKAAGKAQAADLVRTKMAALMDEAKRQVMAEASKA